VSARLIVVTGGPGAGKTALLEVVRRSFCRHVAVLPEAASIVFGGGFPRGTDDIARRAGQRAIFHVQRELERMALETGEATTILCDRGTVDGQAYWRGPIDSFWRDLETAREEELARYWAVLHLHPPSDGNGYDHSNPLRVESAGEAAVLDVRIAEARQGHPRRFFVEHSPDFQEKVARALDVLHGIAPECDCPARLRRLTHLRASPMQ
jgi:predicted ATPase